MSLLRHRHQVIEVNGIALTEVTHEQAVKALQSDPDGVRMKVARVINPNGTNEVAFFVCRCHSLAHNVCSSSRTLRSRRGRGDMASA
jgi:organic hydroperoxide reductase OsmC/OhrA